MAKMELRVRELERLLGKLTLENEMLKRARDLNTKEKRRFIHSNLKRLGTVTRGCKIVGVCRSTYFYKPKGGRPSDIDMALTSRENCPSVSFLWLQKD